MMARRLELSLYRLAPTFEAYCDETTLKTRLQTLAVSVVARNRINRLKQGQISRRQDILANRRKRIFDEQIRMLRNKMQGKLQDL